MHLVFIKTPVFKGPGELSRYVRSWKIFVGEEIRAWGRPGKMREAKQPGTVPVKAGAWTPGSLDVVTCCQEQHTEQEPGLWLLSLIGSCSACGVGASAGHWTRPSSLPGCQVSRSAVTRPQGPGGKQLIVQGLS